jgi:UDP-glucose 4-epimerase
LRTLITGSSGFLGKYLLRRFPEAITLDKAGSPQLLFDLMGKRLRLKEFDLVFHLAANPDVRTNDFLSDILITKNLLDSLEGFKGTFVFTSSSTVYGNALTIPTPEEYSPLIPISLYGASKLACEALILSYAHKYGFKAKILRLANIIGKDGHGVINDFIQKLSFASPVLVIYGDGLQKKSYMYIEDCIDAILLSVMRPGTFFNIGSSDSITVNGIANLIMREMNAHRQIQTSEAWLGDVRTMQLDCQKLGMKCWNSSEAVLQVVSEILQKVKIPA